MASTLSNPCQKPGTGETAPDRQSAITDLQVRTPNSFARPRLLPHAVRTLLCVALATTLRAAEPIDLSHGWSILQDVHSTGEELGLFRENWNPVGINPEVSPWEPIPRLAHLQLLLAPQPYFGRELRYFNSAPWWYRLQFPTPPGTRRATLRFEGVDYYAKVWLNEKLLGEHEGYADPFEFEVGDSLRTDRPNLLIVKVSSPWDYPVAKEHGDKERAFGVIRTMIKGAYEHADTFVQRDVNPVGIWRPVRLIPHEGLRPSGFPMVETNSGNVSVTWPVALDNQPREAQFSLRVVSLPDESVVAKAAQRVSLRTGENRLALSVAVPSPKLWNTWDRGTPSLYRAELELRDGQTAPLIRRIQFGFRSVALQRSQNETRFYLNGNSIYLRGTTYWPDVYISASDRSRYERDLAAMLRAGINAIRVHVHTENPEFYDLCDRLGIAVLQDSDLNWVFPADEGFTQRAVKAFGRTIGRLRNHPSIICWIAMNEASWVEGGIRSKTRPGPQLVAEALKLDPARPVIKNSGDSKALDSGDAHDYRGSLAGGEFKDIFDSKEKLSTEFGVDAPPAAGSLRQVPRLADRLRDVLPRVAELHDYQYRLIKYYIEHYRIQKYAPNAGYFQFMWIDFCPQSFYGIYDYWGRPKSDGIGGGLRALEESNQPIGIFLEYKDAPVALHAVNDSPRDLGDCTAEWTVSNEQGERVTAGSAKVRLGPDSHARVADLKFQIDPAVRYRIALELRGPDGRELAGNVYRDPFHFPAHPRGHPARMDHELGMRLWWAE